MQDGPEDGSEDGSENGRENRGETGAPEGSAEVVEVVGRFEGKKPFAAAVKELLASGFESSDLSVLDTHESLGAAGSPGEAWQDALAGLVGEIKYVGPITAAGLIAIATGPVGAAISATVAAGLTGAALSEVLETVRATPHTESFARALEAGAVLLWVHAPEPAQQARAMETLRRHAAADVHLHRRPPHEAPEAQ